MTARELFRRRLAVWARRHLIAGLAAALAVAVVGRAPAALAAGQAAQLAGASDRLPVGFLSHHGRWLTDAAGRVVLLHGVNMVEKQAPYYPSAFGFGRADASWLRGNGLDVVRLGVLGTGLMPRPGEIDQLYLDRLAATVHELAAEHVYVLLDLHQDGFSPTVGSDGFPAWMTVTNGAVNNHAGFPAYYTSDPATQEAFQSLWNDEPGPDGVALQQDVATMVQALARRFAHDPAVLGYDIFNEPWPGTTWAPCLGSAGCPSLDETELDSFYARIDRAVRSVDQRHLLFIEPFVLFNFGAGTGIAPPGGDGRAGLSFHDYSAPGSPGVFSNALAWSQLTGGGLLTTEWGATPTSSTIGSLADQLDQALMPWIFWAFDEDVVHNLGLPPTGSNLVDSTVSALVRPYPLVVAGTPVRLGYAAASEALTATWSTTEPDGRVAPTGSSSTIEVPPRDYPDGYQVKVTGARVISPLCSRELRLATVAGAGTVSVSISPASRCRHRRYR